MISTQTVFPIDLNIGMSYNSNYACNIDSIYQEHPLHFDVESDGNKFDLERENNLHVLLYSIEKFPCQNVNHISIIDNIISSVCYHLFQSQMMVIHPLNALSLK